MEIFLPVSARDFQTVRSIDRMVGIPALIAHPVPVHILVVPGLQAVYPLIVISGVESFVE